MRKCYKAYSTHICPFEHCPLWPPYRWKWCAMWLLSHHDAPTRWISTGAQILLWPQHPRQPWFGLLCVSANNSPACTPCCECHTGSVLHRFSLSDEITASVMQIPLLYWKQGEWMQIDRGFAMNVIYVSTFLNLTLNCFENCLDSSTLFVTLKLIK